MPVDRRLEHDAETWLLPVLAAGRQLLCVTPRRRGDEPVADHPLADRIRAVLGESGLTTVDVDRLLEDGTPHPWLPVPTEAIDYRPLPVPRRWWSLAGRPGIAVREVESYSSLQAFLNHPHQWVLEHVAALYPGRLADPVLGNRQKGVLLHRLVEWLFGAPDLDWRGADRTAVRRWIDRRLPELLEREGANLHLPGRQREAEELRWVAERALWTLLQHLHSSSATSVRIGESVLGSFSGGRFTGRIDLLAVDANGHEAVVDLKWSRAKARCEELRGDRQLQLAIYAQLRQQVSGRWPDEGYFVLNEARLLAQSARRFPDAVICDAPGTAGSPALWAAFEKTWHWRRGQLDAGRIEVNAPGTEPDDEGVPPVDGLPVASEPDRLDIYRALTGWPEGS
ncbi:hypothetical protein TVNIR_1252 [Thioalkalivibrio nitratireducens DSM 14787]|uniref:PD-(D/E)XK endonuclease-like domain-containing protein n=1 Tax=Thioalkalivibrio nitratireducens (strain DSM 14787 / UNIQEM 213 / ALEN2) TaxID=1255043 RepID=L0DVC6_THIND|nr:PD-(D/E)XK nuclease family protein [Thioalkalivibrio nitratireducens]AGA32925.1 hypothetical protein TVNIR_1252 [Thioalkalivibrio nitratireducens DSM 14787]